MPGTAQGRTNYRERTLPAPAFPIHTGVDGASERWFPIGREDGQHIIAAIRRSGK
jgi:hypothetical protein